MFMKEGGCACVHEGGRVCVFIKGCVMLFVLKKARCGNLLFPSQCHVSIQHTAHHETVGPNIGDICWMNRT